LENGNYIQSTIGSGFLSPKGVAVDSVGNLYVADYGDGVNPGALYLESLSNGSYIQSPIGSGFLTPQAVAVDGLGNVYVADPADGTDSPEVYKLTPAGGSYTQTTIGAQWITPNGIAVDGSGNLYVTDEAFDLGDGFVLKETFQPDGSYAETTLFGNSSIPYPGGLAVDAAANLYVTDNLDSLLYRDDIADPPALNFAQTLRGTTSSDSPKTVTVQNVGNTTMTFSAVGYPSDFPEAHGVSGDCSSNASLPVEGACTLTIDFTPQSINGNNQSTQLSETVSITTNSLNPSGTVQAIAVSGIETTPKATTALTTPATAAMAGTLGTFTATVTGQGGFPAPTGSVTFYSNGTALSTVNLIGGAAGYSTSSLSMGTYGITATYSGDPTYPASSSNILTEQILPPSTFGTENIGSSSTPFTVTITFAARATLGSIAVVTQGVPNLDFTNAGGGTCTVGTAYAANAQCTVKVGFKPRYSGTRLGAVVASDNHGSLIQTVHLEGTGVGPQVSSALGVLHSLASSDNVDLRRASVYALRGICEPSSAAVFMRALDSTDNKVQFDALQGLAALEGFPPERPAPTTEMFNQNSTKYLEVWRRWWEHSGSQKYVSAQ